MQNPLINDEAAKKATEQMFGKEIADLLTTKDVYEYKGDQIIPSTAIYAETRVRNFDGTITKTRVK